MSHSEKTMLSVMSCPMKLTVEGSSVKLKQLTVVVTAAHKSFCGPRSFFSPLL